MTTTFFDHWREVPESAWRWPNFSPAEIACRGTGKLLVNEPALDRLQALREEAAEDAKRGQEEGGSPHRLSRRSTWVARASLRPAPAHRRPI